MGVLALGECVRLIIGASATPIVSQPRVSDFVITIQAQFADFYNRMR